MTRPAAGKGTRLATRRLDERYEILGERRQDLSAVLLDDYEVLDPDAALSGQIDAGLDCYDVRRREDRLRDIGEDRQLVYLEPHAVAQPVKHRSDARGLDLL